MECHFLLERIGSWLFSALISFIFFELPLGLEMMESRRGESLRRGLEGTSSEERRVGENTG